MLTIRDHDTGFLFDPWDHLGPKRRHLLDKQTVEAVAFNITWHYALEASAARTMLTSANAR